MTTVSNREVVRQLHELAAAIIDDENTARVARTVRRACAGMEDLDLPGDDGSSLCLMVLRGLRRSVTIQGPRLDNFLHVTRARDLLDHHLAEDGREDEVFSESFLSTLRKGL